MPKYLAGEFVGRVHRRLSGVRGLLESLAATEDPGLKLAVFSTGPAIRNTVSNLVTEIIGTFVLMFVILSIFGERSDGPASARRAVRRPAGGRHRRLARWPDRVCDQPGP